MTRQHVRLAYRSLGLVLALLVPGALARHHSASALDPASATLGAWSPVQNWPVVAIHAVTLPDGRVLSWGIAGADKTNADLWDPATGQHTPIAEIPYSLFCAGHTLLADGKVFIPGGTKLGADGIIETHIFDPDTLTFRRGPDMNAPRWYPGVTTLGSGDVLIVGGTDTYSDTKWNTLPQVFSPATDSLRSLTGADRPFGTSTVGNPTGTDPVAGYYARMHVTPDGSVYVPGDVRKQSWLDTTGTGAWRDQTASEYVVRSYGSSVLIDPNTALIAGGGYTDISAEAALVNITTGAVTLTAPMTAPRKHQNSVILPTGDVVAVGGETNVGVAPAPPDDPSHPSVLYAESWNRASGGWTKRATSVTQRLYHSTALLLADGRVLSAGGGTGGGVTSQYNAEIYTPWYLFNSDGSAASRPTITTAPATIAYGASVEIVTPQAGSITKATLVRLGAATHAMDQNQRFLDLPITGRSATGLTVGLGANHNSMPPGHYMLSIVDAAGVPSVSKIVKVVEGVVNPGLTAQSISFPAVADRAVGSVPFVLGASATSGLPVSYRVVSGPAGVAGSTVTLSGAAGTVTIEATQAGNGQFQPAPPVQRSFTVSSPTTNPVAYCSARGSQPWEQWIGGVSIGALSFVSSKDGYALVTTTASLAAGSTVSLGLTSGYSYFTWPAGFKVWLDANRDGVFAASEVVFEGVGAAPRPGTAAVPLTGSFVVPAGAVAGSSRLRVVMQRDTVPTGPCTDVVFGEVEDYTVTLAAGGPVVPTLTLGTSPVNQSVEAAVGATSAVVSWVAPTAVSTCPTGSVTVVRTAGPASGSAFPIGDTRVAYTLDDGCANHLDVAFTVTVRAAIVVPPNPGVYCSARGSQPWEQWIGGVSIGSQTFASSKDGYALLNTPTTVLAAGSTVSIGLTSGYSYFTWPAGFKVWLDANRDGVFAASEVVFEGVGAAPRPGTAAVPLTGSFLVPAGAVAGSTRLRVVMQRDTVPTGPCTDVVLGEVEDYTVTLA
jgi:Domain of unknown function (DUF1929)/GEVED domain/HYR domain